MSIPPENILSQLMESIPSDFLEGLSDLESENLSAIAGKYDVNDIRVAFLLEKPFISSRTDSIMEKYGVDALTALQLLDKSEREVDEFLRPVQVIREDSENACGGGLCLKCFN